MTTANDRKELIDVPLTLADVIGVFHREISNRRGVSSTIHQVEARLIEDGSF